MKCPRCQAENPQDSTFCGKCATRLEPSGDAPIAFTATLETAQEELTTGSTFAGRYQIIEELGRGGMGTVYKVHDSQLNEKVALKLIKPEIAADKKIVARFANELKLARKISHPGVGRMYELMEHRGTRFITMEYISGEDLRSMIRMSGQLGIGTAIGITRQVCEGLTEAHRLGVVHRDLKPSNIMIDRTGRARIMDFGIARSVEAKGITGAGIMIGTPEYMSPEQVEGKETDQRSDIYSLGVILYEMLTGRVPFEGDTPFTVGVKHKSETPEDPKKFNSRIPDDLSRIILKCLEKKPEDRFQTTGEICSELARIEQGLPTTEVARPRRGRQTSREVTITFDSRKVLRPALIVLAGLAILFVIWRILPHKKPDLAEKIENSIAVVGFENQTGNPDLDHLRKTIPNLLLTNLENTGLFYVATWERMSDLLRQTEGRNVDIIDSELGFRFCREEGIESIVVGSYSQAGNVFVTDVKILDVETRKLVKSASSTGEGIDSILKTQINELSRTIAEGLGVAREKIDAAPLRIEDVATTSLEAYKHYIQGREAESKFDDIQALRSYEKATELDPNFAYAYRRQSEIHRSLGNSQARLETITKAHTLSRHATEKERLYIEAAYAAAIEKDVEKMLRIYQQIADKYPKEKGIYYNFGLYYRSRSPEKSAEYYEKALELDPDYAAALNELGLLYMTMGRNDEAIELLKRQVAVSPDNPNALDSLAEAFFHMGRLDESFAKYKEVVQAHPEFFGSYMGLSYTCALKQDYAEALRWIDQYIFYAPSLVLKGRGSLFKSLCLSWSGRFEEALKELDVAANLAEAAANGFLKAMSEWMKGCVYSDQGDYERSRSSFKNFIDSESVGRNMRMLGVVCSGLLDIQQGLYDPTKSFLSQMESFLSEVTTNKDFWAFQYEYFKAETLLAEKRYDEAINQFEGASPPEIFLFPQSVIGYHYPALRDVSARALLGKGDISGAIGEYEELVRFDPDSKRRFLIHPKYHFRLAGLYQRQNERTKAIEHYEKFLALWKNADPGIPEVEDAKKRLAELKGA